MQSRSDYTAFGEEIQSGAGLRTANQGFGSANALRQKYGLTERDEATGLDHTWFRKHENQAGRWTSPDPYNGSMSLGDPQSLNRYTYVSNLAEFDRELAKYDPVADYYATNSIVGGVGKGPIRNRKSHYRDLQIDRTV